MENTKKNNNEENTVFSNMKINNMNKFTKNDIFEKRKNNIGKNEMFRNKSNIKGKLQNNFPLLQKDSSFYHIGEHEVIGNKSNIIAKDEIFGNKSNNIVDENVILNYEKLIQKFKTFDELKNKQLSLLKTIIISYKKNISEINKLYGDIVKNNYNDKIFKNDRNILVTK